jgi:hypothetical protein
VWLICVHRVQRQCVLQGSGDTCAAQFVSCRCLFIAVSTWQQQQQQQWDRLVHGEFHRQSCTAAWEAPSVSNECQFMYIKQRG